MSRIENDFKLTALWSNQHSRHVPDVSLIAILIPKQLSRSRRRLQVHIQIADILSIEVISELHFAKRSQFLIARFENDAGMGRQRGRLNVNVVTWVNKCLLCETLLCSMLA